MAVSTVIFTVNDTANFPGIVLTRWVYDEKNAPGRT